jgi:hypothetical protein
MDLTQLAALQAASARLTAAQTAVYNATTDVNAAETAAAAAVTANVTNDIATTSAQVTQAKVALLIAQGEQQQAIDAVNNMMTKPTKSFKPNSQPTPLDIEADKETFGIWETRWNLYIKLSTIIQPASGREEYKATQLLACMSPNTLSTVINARLGDAAMKDSSIIIKYLKDLCNAGKNKHVWRTQFDSCDQRQNQSIDNWLCELRDLSRKCEFEIGCCHLCETERLLGRIVNGVTDNDVRIKLLEVGPNLSLDQAIVIVRTSEMSKLQAEQIHPGGSVQSIQK